MLRIFIILALLVSQQGFAQEHPFNTTDWWNRLVIDSSDIPNTEIDTSIIIVTNRGYVPDSLRFMSEERGDGTLHYLYVYAYKGKWHIKPTRDLQQSVSIASTNSKNWVVYTEGMGKIFPSELDRGMRMNVQYGVNVIMLDYPSITTTKSRIGNYFFAIKHARNAYKDFQPILIEIKNLKEQGALGKGSLNLFFHSMGNYLIRNTVLKSDYSQLNKSVWVNNLILNSACVPQQGHRKWLGKTKFAKQIYINYNPYDRVLMGAKIASKKTQLGNRPKPPILKKAHYVNFNPIIDIGHSNFLNLYGRKEISKTAYGYYNTILNGRSVNFQNKSAWRISQYKNVGYEFKAD